MCAQLDIVAPSDGMSGSGNPGDGGKSKRISSPLGQGPNLQVHADGKSNRTNKSARHIPFRPNQKGIPEHVFRVYLVSSRSTAKSKRIKYDTYILFARKLTILKTVPISHDTAYLQILYPPSLMYQNRRLLWKPRNLHGFPLLS